MERRARTIGVLLSGMLDDGVAGLEPIQRSGGLAVIQDPDDAAYPQLPRNGINAVDPDAIGNVPAMIEFLVQSIGHPVPSVDPPTEILLEARLAGPVLTDKNDVGAIGTWAAVSCPECGGPMWEVGSGRAKLYRCHVGHARSPRVLLHEQDHELERSLWTAVRTLQERATVLERLAREHNERGHDSLSASLTERAVEARDQAERVRQHAFELLSGPKRDDGNEPTEASGSRRPPRR